MAAAITRGKTFSSTETVTNTKLHQLVDDATIADIDASNFDSTTRPVTASATAPITDLVAGYPWYNTTLNIPEWYDGSSFIPDVASQKDLTNKSGDSVALGDVVVVNTSNDDAKRILGG